MLSLMHPWRFSAFFRGASCSVKFRDPTDNSQMVDLTIARCKVNATHKNKRFLFDEHDHERITNPVGDCGGKKYFAPLFAASDTSEGTPCCWLEKAIGPAE
jgi:hypothetical protein